MSQAVFVVLEQLNEAVFAQHLNVGKNLLALAFGRDAEAARELAVGEDFGGIIGEDVQDLVLGDGRGFGLFALSAGSPVVYGGILLKKAAAK